MDKRIKRTKNSIRNALFTISEKKGIQHVTVQDIINKADINRATFYYHYKDKQDLIEKTVEDLLAGVANSIQIPESVHTFVDIAYPPILATFKHVKEYIEWYNMILSEKGIPDFPWKMVMIIQRSVRSNISLLHERKYDLTVNDEFLVNYISGALVSLIIDWVEKGTPESPEFMADQMANVMTHGVYRGKNE